MRKKKKETFQTLGLKVTDYQQTYNPKLLEVFENKHSDVDYTVELEAFEFSCLCPVTGQPDQGTIHIRYVPKDYLVESKSLKLYLFSFRNEGTFHEDVINTICKDLDRVMQGAKYLEVFGRFHSRGGIAIYPRAILCGDKEYEKVAFERKMLAPFQRNFS